MAQRTLFPGFDVPSRITPTGPHQVAVDGWTRLWEEARGTPWAWSARQLMAVKRGLKLAGGDPQHYLDRARDLLMNPPDAYYAQNASPELLVSRWNELTFRVVRQSRDQKNSTALREAMETL